MPKNKYQNKGDGAEGEVVAGVDAVPGRTHGHHSPSAKVSVKTCFFNSK